MQTRDLVVAVACCCIAIGAVAMGERAAHLFPGHDLALSIAGPALIIFGIIAAAAALLSAALEKPVEEVDLAPAGSRQVEDTIKR